ncbi:hypothetical protein CS542_04685 [Pedobacter sp. IW39]|nr:hypothetical protein CS542_04685 [Pedobacter sp. IW39]
MTDDNRGADQWRTNNIVAVSVVIVVCRFGRSRICCNYIIFIDELNPARFAETSVFGVQKIRL